MTGGIQRWSLLDLSQAEVIRSLSSELEVVLRFVGWSLWLFEAEEGTTRWISTPSPDLVQGVALPGLPRVCPNPGSNEFAINNISEKPLSETRASSFLSSLPVPPTPFKSSILSLPPPLPCRISLTPPSNPPGQPCFGTLLYHGPVPPTSGNWYGVEWDDVTRGKHSGVHEGTGVRYFDVRKEGSATFIRPHIPGLSFGTTFSRAVRSKYLPPSSSSSSSDSRFYETTSNFKIEVVLGNVEERFKELGSLREVGLERCGVKGEGVEHGIAGSGGDGEKEEEVGKELVRLETLSLSFSLLPNFESVNSILKTIPSPNLFNLELNSNRFSFPPTSAASNRLSSYPTFNKLRSLHLNKTLLTWSDFMLKLAPSLTNLDELQLGFNEISTLSLDFEAEDEEQDEELKKAKKERVGILDNLKVLNLDSNRLSNFEEVCRAVRSFASLETLILSSNKFESLLPSSANSSSATLPKLKNLNLSDNQISDWRSIDYFNASTTKEEQGQEGGNWNLSGIWLGDNPIFTGIDESYERPITIARIASLTSYSGSPLRETEREDYELFYLSMIAKEREGAGGGGEEHPRRGELEAKYNKKPPPTSLNLASLSGSSSATTPTTDKASPAIQTFKSRLITLNILLPSAYSSSTVESYTIQIPPSHPTRLLRTQILKYPFNSLELNKKKFKMIAILRRSPEDAAEGEEEEEEGLRVEIPVKEEGRRVDWWGLTEGDQVEVVLY